MAKFTGTYVTGDAKGIREDLTDMIYNISPEKTPFFSMIGRGKAKNTLHEWQIDSLAAVDTANAKAEGNETTFATPSATTRLGNYMQISDKSCIVSGTLQKVDKAGRKSEMAYQMSKRAPELRRDMESIALENLPASGTDPRKTAGLPAWLKTNTDFGAGGVDPVYTTLPNDDRTDGTQRAITETILKTVIQECWNSGAEPSVVMTGAHVKSVISGFTGNADKVFNINSAKPGTIIAAADVYVSNFGTLKVIPNRFQRARDAWVLDPEFLSIVYLRGFHSEALAKTGDADKRVLRAEWGLKVHNEAAHGGIFDLSTS